jgi:hypothetical protein
MAMPRVWPCALSATVQGAIVIVAHPVLHVGRFASVTVQWSLGRASAYHVVQSIDGKRVDFWFRKTSGVLRKWSLPVFN